MDISHLFKSKTRKVIFKLYFTNPEVEHYLRDLERTIHIPVSMIRKELVHLEKEGVFFQVFLIFVL
jgi:predicted transcriptional regulator